MKVIPNYFIHVQSNSRTFSGETFWIRNKSPRSVTLKPKTNVGLLVQWGKPEDNQGDNSTYIRSTQDPKLLQICGPSRQLATYQKVQVNVIPYLNQFVLPSKYHKHQKLISFILHNSNFFFRDILAQGKRVPFLGELIFERELEIDKLG